MTASAGTTIEGVSVLSGQRGRRGDRFDIALSRRGIEVRRQGAPAQLVSWDRVSQWEIEEHEGCVLLTLRGNGATTPLLVPGWTLDDFEVLMRDVTSDPGPYVPGSGQAAARDLPERPAAAPAARATTAGPHEAARPPDAADGHHPATLQPRTDRRRQRRRKQPVWKPVVTVVLLGALAVGVTLVLLQSAGVIHWGFLGPVA